QLVIVGCHSSFLSHFLILHYRFEGEELVQALPGKVDDCPKGGDEEGREEVDEREEVEVDEGQILCYRYHEDFAYHYCKADNEPAQRDSEDHVCPEIV